MLNYQTSLLLTQQLSFCERVESLLCAFMCDQRLYFVSQTSKQGLSDKCISLSNSLFRVIDHQPSGLTGDK